MNECEGQRHCRSQSRANSGDRGKYVAAHGAEYWERKAEKAAADQRVLTATLPVCLPSYLRFRLT